MTPVSYHSSNLSLIAQETMRLLVLNKEVSPHANICGKPIFNASENLNFQCLVDGNLSMNTTIKLLCFFFNQPDEQYLGREEKHVTKKLRYMGSLWLYIVPWQMSYYDASWDIFFTFF